MAGQADTLVQALLDSDPDAHSGFDTYGADLTKTVAFLRGFRNCVRGTTLQSAWSTERKDGYRAAQALGLFDVGNP